MAGVHCHMSRFVEPRNYMQQFFELLFLGRDYTDFINFSEGISDPNRPKTQKRKHRLKYQKQKPITLSNWLAGRSTYIIGSSKVLRPHSDHLLCDSEDVKVFL